MVEQDQRVLVKAFLYGSALFARGHKSKVIKQSFNLENDIIIAVHQLTGPIYDLDE